MNNDIQYISWLYIYFFLEKKNPFSVSLSHFEKTWQTDIGWRQ